MIFFIVVFIAFLLLMLVDVLVHLGIRNRVTKLIQPHLNQVSKRKSRIERLYLAYITLDQHKIVLHHLFLQSLSNGNRLVKQLCSVIINLLIPIGAFIAGLVLGGLEIDILRRIATSISAPYHVLYFLFWFIVWISVHFAVSNRTRDIIQLHQVVISQIMEERKIGRIDQ